MNEKLSAFIDGEASSRESAAVLRQLGRDAAARDALSRQLWLRETLKGESLALDLGFADRLAARIDAEDAAQEKSADGKIIEFQPRSRGLRRHWLGPMTGFATAASIVTAVILLGNVGQQEDAAGGQVASQSASSAGQLQVSSNASRPGIGSDVAELTQVARQPMQRPVPRGSNWAVSNPAVEDRLNGYLLEHNGLARGYGLSSATPSFVRVATYGQGSGR